MTINQCWLKLYLQHKIVTKANKLNAIMILPVEVVLIWLRVLTWPYSCQVCPSKFQNHFHTVARGWNFSTSEEGVDRRRSIIWTTTWLFSRSTPSIESKFNLRTPVLQQVHTSSKIQQKSNVIETKYWALWQTKS